MAMSRARQQLYIISAMDYLDREGGTFIRTLVDTLRYQAHFVTLSHFRGSAAQVYGHG